MESVSVSAAFIVGTVVGAVSGWKNYKESRDVIESVGFVALLGGSCTMCIISVVQIVSRVMAMVWC